MKWPSFACSIIRRTCIHIYITYVAIGRSRRNLSQFVCVSVYHCRNMSQVVPNQCRNSSQFVAIGRSRGNSSQFVAICACVSVYHCRKLAASTIVSVKWPMAWQTIRSQSSARKTCKKALSSISRCGHDPVRKHGLVIIDIDVSKDFVSIGHETWPTSVHSRPYGYFLFCMCNVWLMLANGHPVTSTN